MAGLSGAVARKGLLQGPEAELGFCKKTQARRATAKMKSSQ